MPRRVTLPGASELFRPTQPAEPQPSEPQPPEPQQREPSSGGPAPVEAAPVEVAPAALRPEASAVARGSGRVRHDEKITVYVSSDELVALEQARLTLRAEHGMAVDRGRIVREAIAAVIADLQSQGGSSELVRRLSKS
jgi:hypothetical protein